MDALRLRSGRSDEERQIDLSGFMSNISVILQLVTEDALRTSAQFAQSCGRTVVTPRDMELSLRYHAMHFLDQPDLEARFLEAHSEMNDPEEDASSEEDESDGEEASITEEPGEGEYCTSFISGDRDLLVAPDDAFHARWS